VELFGGLTLRTAGRGPGVTRFRSRKTAALLAYLAYHPDRRHLRETLVAMFWPDASSEERARASLAVSLSSLRAQLEPPGVTPGTVVRADVQAVGLNPAAISTDAGRFELLLNRAQCAAEGGDGDGTALALTREAVALYRGPLLPGFDEEWILAEQERLRGRFSDAVRRLATAAQAVSDPFNAITWYRHAVQVDPTDGDAFANLLRLLIASGAEEEASRVFHEIARRLEE
jgi:DNA-binding SARP family transcriptional activator